jgi:hypothetical protein
MAGEQRLHVMVWVDKEFLESEGMLHILHEAGLIADKQADWETIVEAAENTGGFALSGSLAETGHGAGIWISPLESPGIQIMIPWRVVKSVITAEEAHPRLFNLRTGIIKKNGKPTAPSS